MMVRLGQDGDRFTPPAKAYCRVVVKTVVMVERRVDERAGGLKAGHPRRRGATSPASTTVPPIFLMSYTITCRYK